MTEQHPLTNESHLYRPPIGVETEFMWKTNRLHELVLAAGRFIDAQMEVDFDWFLQMSKLIDELNDLRQPQQ